MANTLVDQYIKALAALTGNEFQAEVCARLQTAILGFQTVPDGPQGDGGLDGFSHDGEHGYLCYGPEAKVAKTGKGRETAVVKKFCGDLRRLFELKATGPGKGKQLVHRANKELATILPNGRQLGHIKLICNWFESHRVLNPILSRVAEYKKASTLRFVQASASVVVLGPAELANAYAVDEFTIARARQQGFLDRVQARAQTEAIADPKDFNWKIGLLEQIRPEQVPAIKKLADGLREQWRTALAFERELGDSLPDLHQELELARQVLATRVATLMISSTQPWTELEKAEDLARQILGEHFDRLYGSLMQRVSQGEVARLIGECTIGWKAP